VVDEADSRMDEILTYLVNYCSFLWARAYTIARSGYGSDIDNAYVDVVSRSKTMKLEFIWEHGRLYLDVHGLLKAFGRDRYPIDILRAIVLDEPYLGDILSGAHIGFLRDNIETIEAMFADEDHAPELRIKVGDHIKARLRSRS
jgi:hypothetical protein